MNHPLQVNEYTYTTYVYHIALPRSQLLPTRAAVVRENWDAV